VLFPEVDVEPNPFNSTAELRASLSPERLPEKALHDAPRIEIEDAPRDVMMFRGNAIWHLRSNRAGAVMLYLKLNALRCDPLGEDPRSVDCRTTTESLLMQADAELERCVPVVGRRVDSVQRRYTRDWREAVAVVLWGEPPFLIDEIELRALRAMDGRRTISAVVEEIGVPSRAAALASLRRLAARGVVDLLPPS
jgi:hypothetical protein